jgi:hypothetical protein
MKNWNWILIIAGTLSCAVVGTTLYYGCIKLRSLGPDGMTTIAPGTAGEVFYVDSHGKLSTIKLRKEN